MIGSRETEIEELSLVADFRSPSFAVAGFEQPLTLGSNAREQGSRIGASHLLGMVQNESVPLARLPAENTNG